MHRHELTQTAEHRAADRRAGRIAGWMMLIPGILAFVPPAFMVADLPTFDVIWTRPFLCSFALGAPLVIGGLRRLLRPER
jgi:hypothetical protein